MHRPHDEYERELYGAPATRPLRSIPAWRFLRIALAMYAVVGLGGFVVRLVDLSPAGLESVIRFRAMLIVFASVVLAGWFMILAISLVRRVAGTAR